MNTDDLLTLKNFVARHLSDEDITDEEVKVYNKLSLVAEELAANEEYNLRISDIRQRQAELDRIVEENDATEPTEPVENNEENIENN